MDFGETIQIVKTNKQRSLKGFFFSVIFVIIIVNIILRKKYKIEGKLMENFREENRVRSVSEFVEKTIALSNKENVEHLYYREKVRFIL